MSVRFLATGSATGTNPMRWLGYIMVGFFCTQGFAAETLVLAPPATPFEPDPIESIVEQEGALSKRLIQPLLEQGRIQLENGDYVAAEDTLRRAQHIIHRHEGVHALSQLEVLELMTDIYLAKSEPLDADRQQQLALYLSERNYGKDSSQNLPALFNLADWYTDTGQYTRAREALERATTIIRAEGDDNDPRLIEPLLKAAAIKRLHRLCCSYREVEEALEILDAQNASPNDLRVEVLMALGDAYIASRKDEEAKAAWQEAWALLGDEAAEARFSDPAQIAMARELASAERILKSGLKVYEVSETSYYNSHPFGSVPRERTLQEQMRAESEPPQQFLVPLGTSTRNFHIAEAMIDTEFSEQSRQLVGRPFQFILSQLQTILPPSARHGVDLASLSVEVQFTVHEDGNVSDVEVLNESAPLKLVRLMREVISKSKFRPRIVGGEPVKTELVRLTQRFDQ